VTAELERTIEALLFLSPEPVALEAIAEATESELHEVATALERLREHYEFRASRAGVARARRRVGAVEPPRC